MHPINALMLAKSIADDRRRDREQLRLVKSLPPPRGRRTKLSLVEMYALPRFGLSTSRA